MSMMDIRHVWMVMRGRLVLVPMTMAALWHRVMVVGVVSIEMRVSVFMR